MANRERGEVELAVGDKTYTLRLGHNAMAEAEQLMDMSFQSIIAALSEGRTVDSSRALLWAALRKHHPDLTLLDVGELMDEVPDSVIGEKLGEVIVAAFPSAAGNPQTPPRGKAAGSGTNSSRRGARSS